MIFLVHSFIWLSSKSKVITHGVIMPILILIFKWFFIEIIISIIIIFLQFTKLIGEFVLFLESIHQLMLFATFNLWMSGVISWLYFILCKTILGRVRNFLSNFWKWNFFFLLLYWLFLLLNLFQLLFTSLFLLLKQLFFHLWLFNLQLINLLCQLLILFLFNRLSFLFLFIFVFIFIFLIKIFLVLVFYFLAEWLHLLQIWCCLSGCLIELGMVV